MRSNNNNLSPLESFIFQDHQYLGVSGFLFLRFLVPAIMNPKLFYLQDRHPNKRTSRTLTLLAKIVQNIGNLRLTLGKESYLEPMLPFIEHSVTKLKKYLDDLVNVTESAGA